jgi:hypothetical protein
MGIIGIPPLNRGHRSQRAGPREQQRCLWRQNYFRDDFVDIRRSHRLRVQRLAGCPRRSDEPIPLRQQFSKGRKCQRRVGDRLQNRDERRIGRLVLGPQVGERRREHSVGHAIDGAGIDEGDVGSSLRYTSQHLPHLLPVARASNCSTSRKALRHQSSASRGHVGHRNLTSLLARRNTTEARRAARQLRLVGTVFPARIASMSGEVIRLDNASTKWLRKQPGSDVRHWGRRTSTPPCLR